MARSVEPTPQIIQTPHECLGCSGHRSGQQRCSQEENTGQHEAASCWPGQVQSEFLRCPRTLPRRASAAKQACPLSSLGERKGSCSTLKRPTHPQPWGWQPHRPSVRGRFCARTSKHLSQSSGLSNPQGCSTEKDEESVISQAGQGHGLVRSFNEVHMECTRRKQ